MTKKTFMQFDGMTMRQLHAEYQKNKKILFNSQVFVYQKKPSSRKKDTWIRSGKRPEKVVVDRYNYKKSLQMEKTIEHMCSVLRRSGEKEWKYSEHFSEFYLQKLDNGLY